MLAEKMLLADTIPIAMSDYGVASLASYLGCSVRFGEDTIWYEPFITDTALNDDLIIDRENKWYRIHFDILKTLHAHRDEFFIGASCMSPGIDALYEMRGSDLLTDFYDRPDWVHMKQRQQQASFFETFDEMYEYLKRDDGSMVVGYFSLFGKGKTMEMQCDISAMLSADLYREFELPYLEERCERLDRTMYHLDGTQAQQHLPALLSVKGLNAIEWTPQASIERGGNPRWYGMYEQILAAGKSLQVVETTAEETVELFKTFGSKGLNCMTTNMTRRQAEDMLDKLENYR